MIKKPLHIKYNRLCYYCICQACNMLHCPFSRHRSRSEVCSRCLSLKNPRPRLDCDFFQHVRKTNLYWIRGNHIPPGSFKNCIYCVTFNGYYYGPFTYEKALKFKKLRGGSIHILNITDYEENW